MVSEKSKEERESDEVERKFEIRDFGLELNRGFLRMAIFFVLFVYPNPISCRRKKNPLENE